MSVTRFLHKATLASALVGVTAFSALAQETGATPGYLDEGGFFDADNPDVVINLRLGGQVASSYFGSDELETGPDFAVRFDYLRFPNGFEYGSGDAVGFRRGWGLRGSTRIISSRNSADYPELAGLDDIGISGEFGFGIGYEQKNYRGFADLRYGLIGHHAFVGELGADVIATPLDGWTLTFGPRVTLGSDSFTDTYFGITPDEAAESSYSAYNPNGGPVEAGLEFSARYDFNELWGLEGIVKWNRYIGDAAKSPIVLDGSDENLKIEIGVTRRISLDF